MEPFGSILGALGSIASIISLVALWKKGGTWILRGLLLSVAALTVLSSYFSYQYFALTKPAVERLAKQESLRTAVQGFIKNNYAEVTQFDIGANEGIVNSGLIILEIHQELFPDTYKKIKSEFITDNEFVQNYRDKHEHRRASEVAAQRMLTLLKALAGVHPSAI